ncbi:hypothetical protein J7E62_00835 [Variovorax paradoxus]|nr:hypothetical protein [Variovorax paradoxus]
MNFPFGCVTQAVRHFCLLSSRKNILEIQPNRSHRTSSPTLGQGTVPRNTDSARPEWTKDLGRHVHTAEASRALELNKLICSGHVPSEDWQVQELVNQCLDLDEAVVLELLLKNVPMDTLTLARKNLASEKISMLIGAMDIDTRISSLVLSHGSLRSPEIKQLQRLMEKTPSLNALTLSSMTLTHDKFNQLADSIIGETKLTSLQWVVGPSSTLSYETHYGTWIVNILKNKRELKNLDIRHIRLKHETHKEIAKRGLKDNSNLAGLKLFNCSIGERSAKEYARCLESNTALKSLDLGQNHLREGSDALIEALQKNESLSHLSLAATFFESDWVRSFSYLPKNLSKLIEQGKLQVLDIRQNKLSDEDLVSVMDALKNNTNLHKLDLSENNVELESIAHLSAALRSNTSLRSVKLPKRALNGAELDLLISAMEINRTLSSIHCTISVENKQKGERLEVLLDKNRTIGRMAMFQGGVYSLVGNSIGSKFAVTVAELVSHSRGRLNGNVGLINKLALDRARKAQAEWEAMQNKKS